MPKIAFIGAGSTIFVKNVSGYCMLTPALADAHIALHDIDLERLKESERMLVNLGRNLGGKATIKAYADRREALRGADYVINAISGWGFRACHPQRSRDPRKYGLKQTYADTLGMGGLHPGSANDRRDAGIRPGYGRAVSRCWFLRIIEPDGDSDGEPF